MHILSLVISFQVAKVFSESVTKSSSSKRQLFYSLRWPIYVFNSVANTKLPAILSHRRSTKVSLETYPPMHLYLSL